MGGHTARVGLLALAGCASAELDAFPPPSGDGLLSELLRPLGLEASLATRAVDLSAPRPVFVDLSRPIEADAFLFQATLAQLGFEPGVVPAGLDGLFLPAPDLALRRADGAWRPLTPGEIEASPLHGQRSRHDIGTCSVAGGCYVGEGERCAAPCTVDSPRPPAPPSPPRPPMFTPCPPGFVERAGGEVTTCAPSLADADCAGETFAFPGATACVDLDRDGPWPAGAPGKRVVYVGAGGTGSGATPDDPLRSIDALASLGEPVVARLLGGYYDLQLAPPPGTELVGAPSTTLSLSVRDRVDLRISHVALGKVAIVSSSSVTFDGVWGLAGSLDVGRGSSATFRRCDLGPGPRIKVLGELALAETRARLTGLSVPSGGKLVARRSALTFTEGLTAEGGEVRLTEVDVVGSGLWPGSLLDAGEQARVMADRLRVSLTSPEWTESASSEAAIKASRAAAVELRRIEVQISALGLPAAHDAVSVARGPATIADAVLVGGYRGATFDEASVRLDRVAIAESSVAGVSFYAGRADVFDLAIDRIGEAAPDPRGFGVWVRRGAAVDGARLRIREVATLGLSLGWDGKPDEPGEAAVTLEHVEIDAPRADGVRVRPGHGLTLQRARVAVGGRHALWSEAPVVLADLDVVSGSTHSDALFRLCPSPPAAIERLRVEAPARTGPLLDLVAQAVIATYEDLDLTGGSHGIYLQAHTAQLALRRLRVAGAGGGVGWRGLDPDFFLSPSPGEPERPPPCARTRDAREPADPGILANALLTIADATFEAVDRCFAVALPEDLCAASTQRLRALGASECAWCAR